MRGNGKIIQELEGDFRGSGWNVIKLIWGGYWDPLLAHDKEGILRKIMEETFDGEYQAYKANDGKFVREHFFGKHPKLLEAVSRMSDEDIWRLNRGGHDPHKVFAAFDAATKHEGQPTVILAKTIKGYGMGHVGQAKNPTHQQKKLELDSIREFRDRFAIPIPDDQLADLPYFKPAEDSPEMKYLHERRAALGGYLPRRRQKADEQLKAPALDAFKAVLEPTAEGREISTTQAFVRILNQVLRDRTWVRASCRSWPTNRAPSAWKACSARSASTRRKARSTPRSTRTRSCTTRKRPMASSCRKASTKRAR